jgi:HSP20 family protein
MFHLTPWKKKPETLGAGLVPEGPESRLGQLRDEIDDLVARFREGLPAVEEAWLPKGFGWKFDLEEKDQEYLVRAEVPGFEPDEIRVEVRGNQLAISAEHKEESTAEGDGKACRYGRFQRTAALPPGADPDKVTARYHSGVLEVHLPKEPALQGKRISVQAS